MHFQFIFRELLICSENYQSVQKSTHLEEPKSSSVQWMLLISWKNGDVIVLTSSQLLSRKYSEAGEQDKVGTSWESLKLWSVLTGSDGRTRVTSRSWNSAGSRSGPCWLSKSITVAGKLSDGSCPWPTTCHQSLPSVGIGHGHPQSSRRPVFYWKNFITSGG